MAKVTVTVDTESKDFSVDIDGKVLDDVRSVNIYKDEYARKEHVSVNISLEDEEENGVRTCTYISASASKNGQEALSKEKCVAFTTDKTLVQFTKNKSIEQSIASILKSS